MLIVEIIILSGLGLFVVGLISWIWHDLYVDQKNYDKDLEILKRWKQVSFGLPIKFHKNSQVYINGLLQSKEDYKIKEKNIKFRYCLIPDYIFCIYDHNHCLQYKVNEEDYNKSRPLKNGLRRIYIKK